MWLLLILLYVCVFEFGLSIDMLFVCSCVVLCCVVGFCYIWWFIVGMISSG